MLVCVSSMATDLNAVFSGYDNTTPGCSAAAERSGEVVFSASFGSANLEHGVAITPTTRFYSGSVSKQFTAAAIAMLAMDGKLSLDDRIGKHFPELPGYAAEASVRQLVHHTSGLRDYTTLIALQGRDLHNSITEAEILDLIAAQKAGNFEPGTQYSYSNSGYFLLGMLVERVSGQTLREFTEKRIFAPLRMTRSHFHDNHLEMVPERAEGYLHSETGWQGNRTRVAQVGGGGLITTANDLLKWNAWLHSDDNALKQLMLSKGKLKSGKTISYGFGVSHGQHNGLPTISHGGSLGGFRANLAWYPEQHLSIAVLCNLDQVSPKSKSDHIAEIVLGKPARSASEGRRQVSLEVSQLEPLVGSYALSPTFEIEVSLDGKQLYAQATGQPRHPVFPESASKFFYKVVEAQLEFSSTGLTLTQNGAEHAAEKIVERFVMNRAENDYEGVYFSEELNASTRIYRDKNKLWSRTSYADPVPLVPIAEDRFAVRTADVTFSRNSAGDVDGMNITLPRVHELRYERQRSKKATALSP